MIIGGGLLLVLLGEIGWRAAFFVMAAVALVCTLPTALHTEAPPAAVEGAAVGAGGRSGAFEIFARFFRRPGALPWLGFLALFKAGEAMGVSMLRPMLVDRGLSLIDIGWVLGGAGFSAGLLGALVGGAALQPLGRRRALLLFGALQALMVGGYALLATLPLPLPGTLLLCVGEHFTSGLATAVLFTWMMDACGAEHAGTDYTIQASVVVFATGIAGAVAGFSAAALGYPAHFALSGLVALVALLPPLLNRGSSRGEGPRPTLPLPTRQLPTFGGQDPPKVPTIMPMSLFRPLVTLAVRFGSSKAILTSSLSTPTFLMLLMILRGFPPRTSFLNFFGSFWHLPLSLTASPGTSFNEMIAPV
jgi:predicted MFS family arabinose efflux permease